MQTAGNSVPSTPKPTQEACAKAIREAEDLVSALECVGGMCGIPSENIIADDTLDNIKVQGDVILAPSVPATGHGNAIMKSIAAVLDYISQRIDSKLNTYQNTNINNGMILDHVASNADPSKGKIIGRYVTPEDDEIIVYDSGIVSAPNTPSARTMVTDLRNRGIIPQVNINKPLGIQYFTDEDDITKDVDMPPTNDTSSVNSTNTQMNDNDLSSNNIPGLPSQPQPGTEVDMETKIGESGMMLDMVSKYGNTRHLGYDIMTEMGIDFIKPVDFLLESGDNDGKKKKILPTEIKHMKFDNTHILKAVKLFNSVRAEQKDVKGNDFDINKMVNSPNWHKAIQELEKQFDCHLVIHYLKDDENPRIEDGSTSLASYKHEYRQNVTVSKSKGFQLNGLPITIFLLNNFLINNTPTDQSLFGQAVVSILLHEIFHNIMEVFRTYNTEFNAMLTTTMITASLTKNAKVRRKLITNFANAVDAMSPKGEKMTIIQKRAYIKRLLLLCSLKEGSENMKLAQSLIEDDDLARVDDYIKKAEEFQARYEKKVKGVGMNIGVLISGAIGLSLLAAGLANPTLWLVIVGGGTLLGSYTTFKIGNLIKSEMRKDIASRERGDVHDYEEQWADMFAAMYNLPVALFTVPRSRATAATMTDEQIKRIHQIEMKWVTLMGDEHPPTTERLASAVKCAQQTLDSGIALNPDVKKYLEWIIANHSRILEVEDIDNIYSKATFDPKTADDIDLHIANLISRTNSNITEQALR